MLQNGNKKRKGDEIIHSTKIKVISLILAVILSISVPICAYAEESAGLHNLATGNAQEIENINTFEMLNSFENANTPSAPSFTVKVSNVNDDSALLTWQGDTLYISYTICKYNVITGDYEEYLVTPHTSARLTGLSADTNYKFCVKSTVSDELLGVARFVTSTRKISVKIDEVTSSEVSLSFENVEEGAAILLYRASDNGDYKKIAAIKGDASYVDTDVDEGTTYSYRARSVFNGFTKKLVSEYSTAKDATTAVSMDLPNVSGRCKTYAYYTACNIKSTPQYRLLNSPDTYTDEETGIRMVDGCYCVALGSFYGSKIGTKYRVTFSTGNSIKVILCDQKANCHTDKNNQYAVRHRDIMEFYVEKGKIPSNVRGDYGRLEQFKGKIVSIEKYIEE